MKRKTRSVSLSPEGRFSSQFWVSYLHIVCCGFCTLYPSVVFAAVKEPERRCPESGYMLYILIVVVVVVTLLGPFKINQIDC